MTILNTNNHFTNFPKILYFPILSSKALSLHKFNQYSFYINSAMNKKILKIFFELKFNLKIKCLKIIKIKKIIKKSLFSRKAIITIFQNDTLSSLSLLNTI